MKYVTTLVIYLLSLQVNAAEPLKIPSQSNFTVKSSEYGRGTEFVGKTTVSDRLIFQWIEEMDELQLNATMELDDKSINKIPIVNFSSDEILQLTNVKESARFYLGLEVSQKLINKEFDTISGPAKLEIGELYSVIDCDRRHFLAKLFTVVK